MSANLIFDHPTDAIAVARFARPDVREALYHFGHEHDDIGESTLYRELWDGALTSLPAGGTLVLNFGLVEAFTLMGGTKTFEVYSTEPQAIAAAHK